MFRSKATTTFVAIGLTALALAGCNYSPPAEPVDEPVGVSVDAARVTVTDPGGGDKHQLGYEDIGSKQQLTFELEEGFAQDLMQASAVDGYSADNLTSTTTTLDLTGEVDKATEDPEQAPATRNAFFTADNGFQFGWRGGDNGQISSLRLAAPQDAADEDRAATEQAVIKLIALPVVFPDEPVGNGGSWTVESRVPGDTSLLQTTTYTVTGFEGTRVNLDVGVSQRPSIGALEYEDTELAVLDSSTQASGNITVDTTTPLPVSGDVDITTEIVYGDDSSDLRVVQTVETSYRFRS